MVYNSSFRLTLLSVAIILGISLSVVSVAADGILLRSFDVPFKFKSNSKAEQPFYWPIGAAFDGKNLWYSQPANGTTAGIFQVTTSGVLLQTLSAVKMAGALGWDGSNLWVGSYTDASFGVFLYQISTSGVVLKTIDISSIYRADGACGFTDGLDFDAVTGTLWVSPDPCNTGCQASVGFIYNIDTTGKLLRRIQMPFGVAGVALVGKDLYIVDRCGAGGSSGVSIVHLTTQGKIISSFPIAILGDFMWAEDLSFDASTFAPACALWAMQPYFPAFNAELVAYSIACP